MSIRAITQTLTCILTFTRIRNITLSIAWIPAPTFTFVRVVDGHTGGCRPDSVVPSGLIGRGPGGGQRRPLSVAEGSSVRGVPGGEVRCSVVWCGVM